MSHSEPDVEQAYMDDTKQAGEHLELTGDEYQRRQRSRSTAVAPGPRQRIGTAEIQAFVLDAATLPHKGPRRIARHALLDALIREGMTSAQARTMADRLISEARR